MKSKKIGPQVSTQTIEFFGEKFKSTNAGAEYTLAAFPGLYQATLTREIKGVFTAGELSLMLDVFNATMLTPALAGQHLNCIDGMELDHLDEKWEINKAEFTKKLNALTIFQANCLEIWANGFWYSGATETRGLDLEKYVAVLATK